MTAWTDHIREYAKKHGLTYACALSQPDCAATYKGKKAEAPAKAAPAKKMAKAPKPKPEPKAPKPKPEPKAPKPKPEPKPVKAVIGKAVRVSKKKLAEGIAKAEVAAIPAVVADAAAPSSMDPEVIKARLEKTIARLKAEGKSKAEILAYLGLPTQPTKIAELPGSKYTTLNMID